MSTFLLAGAFCAGFPTLPCATNACPPPRWTSSGWSTPSAQVRGRFAPPRTGEGEMVPRRHAAPSAQVSGLDKMVQGRAGDAQNFRDRRFRDHIGDEFEVPC